MIKAKAIVQKIYSYSEEKAKRKIAEKSAETEALSDKIKERECKIEQFEASYKDALKKCDEQQTELDARVANQNSMEKKFEYRIDFLEEKLKKTVKEKNEDSNKYENKIKALEEVTKKKFENEITKL